MKDALRENSVRAMAASYRRFDVECRFPHGSPVEYVVVGYRNFFFRYALDIFEELCVFKSLDKAWSFVYLLRAAREGRDISGLLKEVEMS